jgi:indolepyruvate ferredoxin oxidoreductase beta subunit
MNNKNYNLLNVGVGGQGVIRTIQIIAWAALKSNYEVRATETHGMAQRGGSVTSFIRFGTKVEGPLIPRGHADVILAFEASEALRNRDYAGPNTLFLIKWAIITPL